MDCLFTRAFAARKRRASLERGSDPVDACSVVTAMQDSAHRQCAGEAGLRVRLRSACNPLSHLLPYCSGMRRSSTWERPPEPLKVTWTCVARTSPPPPPSAAHPTGPALAISCCRVGRRWHMERWRTLFRCGAAVATTCKLMDRLWDQRIAKASRSTRTKHVVRGKMLAIPSSIVLPRATGRTASGVSPGTAAARTWEARNMSTAAAESGVKRGKSRPKHRFNRSLKSCTLRHINATQGETTHFVGCVRLALLHTT
eukprot:7388824-Prymnesium_polylepis.1